MKERPILFSGPMIRAILEGRKTQTRRPLKGCGVFVDTEMNMPPPVPTDDGWQFADGTLVRCQWRAGDRLWVRETWRFFSETKIQYRCDEKIESRGRECEVSANAFFRRGGASLLAWHPSIHMPRWASRLTLEIVGVRVGRLQDINETDAKAEGVESVSIADVPRNAVWSAWQDFAQLWHTIYGPDSWDANPWVTVVEFKRKET
jgi:hypothetical protein